MDDLNSGKYSEFYVKVDNVWRRATPYVKVDGVWKLAQPWGRLVGYWRVPS